MVITFDLEDLEKMHGKGFENKCFGGSFLITVVYDY